MFFYIWHMYFNGKLTSDCPVWHLWDHPFQFPFQFIYFTQYLLFFIFICFCFVFFSLTINRFSFQRSAFVCAAFTGAQNQFMTDIRIILETVYFSVFQWHVVRYQYSKIYLNVLLKKDLQHFFFDKILW